MLKEEIADCITDKLKLPRVTFSTGSTEPKELFVSIIDALGLEFQSRRNKPEMARLIVESAGFVWRPEFESTGATVTRQGLEAVLGAVDFFLNEKPNSRL